MVKAKLEWLKPRSALAWKTEETELRHSRKGNYYCKGNAGYPTERVFVVSKLEKGCVIVTKQGDEWVECGRVVKELPVTPVLFIGEKDHPSRAEFNELTTPTQLPEDEKENEDKGEKKEEEEDEVSYAFTGVDMVDEDDGEEEEEEKKVVL